MRYPKLEHFSEPNVITTTADFIFSWARSHSVFPFTYGLACCAIEMLSSGFARYDVARFGMEVFRPTPRQCDLMIVAGTVNEKMAPVLKRLYDQMSEPKWVISMGACANSGGPFYEATTSSTGSTRSCRSTSTSPAARRAPRPCSRACSNCRRRSSGTRSCRVLPSATDAGRG